MAWLCEGKLVFQAGRTCLAGELRLCLPSDTEMSRGSWKDLVGCPLRLALSWWLFPAHVTARPSADSDRSVSSFAGQISVRCSLWARRGSRGPGGLGSGSGDHLPLPGGPSRGQAAAQRQVPALGLGTEWRLGRPGLLFSTVCRWAVSEARAGEPPAAAPSCPGTPPRAPHAALSSWAGLASAADTDMTDLRPRACPGLEHPPCSPGP